MAYFIDDLKEISNLNKNCKCKVCTNSKLKTGHPTFDKETFVNKCKNIHGDKYDYDKVNYINLHHKVAIYCKQCNKYFIIVARKLLENHGCPSCKNKNKNHVKPFTFEEFINKAKSVHGNEYDYSMTTYINSRTEIKIKCNKCKFVFYQKPNSHINGNGCPNCIKSKGEILIKKFLDNHNISYVTEKTFEGCYYKSKLRFDFYLPDFNICIEYDGPQHLKPYTFFGGIETFNKIQIRDNIKNDFCKENNINLIHIFYGKNIDEILTERLLCTNVPV